MTHAEALGRIVTRWPNAYTEAQFADLEQCTRWLTPEQLDEAIGLILVERARQEGAPFPGDIRAAHYKLNPRYVVQSDDASPPKPMIPRELAERQLGPARERLASHAVGAAWKSSEGDPFGVLDHGQRVIDAAWVRALELRLGIVPDQEGKRLTPGYERYLVRTGRAVIVETREEYERYCEDWRRDRAAMRSAA